MGGKVSWWITLVGLSASLTAAGCSEADGSGSGARGSAARGQSFGPMSQAGSGGDAPAAPVDPSGFGNSSADPAASLPQQPLVEEMECPVGERCGPNGPDPDDCGSLRLEAELEVIEHPGNVMLVFDRSGSMAFDWGSSTRWEMAGQAILNALSPLADKITMAGSVFFPSADPDAPLVCIDPTGITCLILPQLAVPGGTCSVNPITEPDQLDFQPGPDFIAAFQGVMNQAPIYTPVPGGLTPLMEGLQEAQTALAAVQDTLDGVTSVVIITDGEPNCTWDPATSPQIVTQIVTDWAAAGINTHVIGLPGADSGGAPQILNDLAAAGGTGQYITPDDAAALEDKLRQIVLETVMAGFESCDIPINPPAEAPEKLHLVVTEAGSDSDVPRDLADDFSWAISDEGDLVTLEGRLCDDATGGRFEALRFEFGCVDLPPLPPPPPLE